MSNWISVDERRPGPFEDVLGANSSTWRGVVRLDGKGLWEDHAYIQAEKGVCRPVVTHWMPLPEPPNEIKENFDE